MKVESISQKWPVKFMPGFFVFLDKGLIYCAACEAGGFEIHVESKQPVRKECLSIMNSVGGKWFTSILSNNVAACNLAIKCGMSFLYSKIKNGKEYRIYGGYYGSYR